MSRCMGVKIKHRAADRHWLPGRGSGLSSLPDFVLPAFVTILWFFAMGSEEIRNIMTCPTERHPAIVGVVPAFLRYRRYTGIS